MPFDIADTGLQSTRLSQAQLGISGLVAILHKATPACKACSVDRNNCSVSSQFGVIKYKPLCHDLVCIKIQSHVESRFFKDNEND